MKEGTMNGDTQTSAENALRKTADSVGQLADKVQETVRQTQERLNQLQQDVVDRTRYAAQTTDTYVHEKPWNAVCGAMAVGFIVGLIVGRR
jgi:ElaB/YqjD/DUF883 family membrane-anchored ribosome-binding protein